MIEMTTHMERWTRALQTQQAAAISLAQVPFLAGAKTAEAGWMMVSVAHQNAMTVALNDAGAETASAQPSVAKVTPRLAKSSTTAKPKVTNEVSAPKKAPARGKKPSQAKPKVVSVKPAGGKAVSLTAMPDEAGTPKAEKVASPVAEVKPVAKPATPVNDAAKPAAQASDIVKEPGTGKVPVLETGPSPKESSAAKKAPQTAPQPKQTPQRNELTRIKGIGPRLATKLNQLGVTTVAQIAACSDEDIERIDSQLGSFQGRAKRGNWVENAKALIEESTEGDPKAK